MHAYIVKTGDGYLYPFAGDASLTDREEDATRYASTEEANESAQKLGYVEGTYQVIAIDVDGKRDTLH